jgi:hypothetical protein
MTSLRRGVAAVAVGVGLWATAGTASAQVLGGLFSKSAGCDTGTCATGQCSACDTKCSIGGKTGLVGPRSGWRGPYGPFGLKIYPLFERRYITQFPCPTVAPGTCFGYRKTQWTRWDEACPNWDGGHPVIISHPVPSDAPTGPTMPPPTGTAPMSPTPSAPMPGKPPEKPADKPGVEKGMGLPAIPAIPQVPVKAPAPTPVRGGKS